MPSIDSHEPLLLALTVSTLRSSSGVKLRMVPSTGISARRCGWEGSKARKRTRTLFR